MFKIFDEFMFKALIITVPVDWRKLVQYQEELQGPSEIQCKQHQFPIYPWKKVLLPEKQLCRQPKENLHYEKKNKK